MMQWSGDPAMALRAIRGGFALFLCVALVSCRSQRTVTESQTSMGPILEKFAGNYQIERDATGMAKVKSDRRSEFEAKAFRGTGDAGARKEFRTKEFSGSREFSGRKGFSGGKEYSGSGARADEAGRASRWHFPWNKDGEAFRDGNKEFAASAAREDGVTVPVRAARDAGKRYSAPREPSSLGIREYPDDAIHNIRSPSAGEGPGPSVRDVRGMLGKDG